MAPAQPPAMEREVEVVEGDPGYGREALLDELRSVKRAVALLGVISVLALGAAVWALLTQEEESDARRGATASSVSQLRERVDELENDVEDAASGSTVSKLRSDQQDLDERVDKLSQQTQDAREAAQDGGDATEAQEAAEQLGQQVDDLEQRLETLEQDAGGEGETP